MLKEIFADDSDSDVEIRTTNEYAKNYDIWRKKEELNKLKTKYGEDNLNFDEESFSSSSSDDDDGIELSEKTEKDFFKTLAALKNKDPRIYDERIVFFDHNAPDEKLSKAEKNKKEQPVFLKDYERKLLLEKGGVLSDEEEGINLRSSSPTFAEERQRLKEQIKVALDNIDDDLRMTERKKTKEEKEREEADCKKWLAGQDEKVDETMVSELKPLKDFWNHPQLDEGEKFLRDYLLNKKFLDKDDENYIPTYDEIIHDSDENLSNDEKEIEKQDEFEHKYNFRFEEPDQEFIKRFPRTIESSLRKKDDRRKVKRTEIKERKKKEKEEKFVELKKFQELKRKEIEEKIEKLKEITGNEDVGFKVDDIDGDFDPEAHDKRMQALFNDQFYDGSEEEQKPVFPDMDEELELENWDRWDGNDESSVNSQEPHCEDDNFNMDADYDPSHSSTQNELIERSQGKKKRKRKSKFAQALAVPKPKYDPYDKNYEKYFEEYYKLDCEDIIGDVPCRFKYREVVPNSFGLTIEEILLAKDRELNKWCSLKKSVQRRPEHIERYEQIAYSKKAENLGLKKKILPSLFMENGEEEGSTSQKREQQDNFHMNESDSQNLNENNVTKNLKKKNKNKKLVNAIEKVEKTNVSRNKEMSKQNVIENGSNSNSPIKNTDHGALSNERANCGHIVSKVNVKKMKNGIDLNEQMRNVNDKEKNGTSRKNKKRKLETTSEASKKKRLKKNSGKAIESSESNPKGINKKKGLVKNRDKLSKTGLTDARLAAYGINPKKFKNKLKYANN